MNNDNIVFQGGANSDKISGGSSNQAASYVAFGDYNYGNDAYADEHTWGSADFIYGPEHSNRSDQFASVYGGDGDDYIEQGSGSYEGTTRGESGDDTIIIGDSWGKAMDNMMQGFNYIFGDSGNDDITFDPNLSSRDGNVRTAVHGGSGDDLINLPDSDTIQWASGGQGDD